MIKNKHSLVALTTTVLAVSACVQQIWKVTYPGPNDYFSESYDVAVDSEQNTILLGRTLDEENNKTLFAAKYNATGNLIWAYEDPGYFNIRFPNKDYLSVNNDNHILLAGIRLEPELQAKITLLNEQGEKLWDKQLEGSFNFPFFHDLATTSDNQYLVIASSHGLKSFSQNGDLLWQFPIWGTPTDNPDIDLPDFGGKAEINTAAATANTGFLSAEVIVNANNEIFAANNGQIFKLDNLGNEVQSLLYSELADGSIIDMAINNNNVAILGISDNQSTVHLLNNNLELINSHTIDIANTEVTAIDITDSGQVCFAVIDGFSETSTLLSGSMNHEGLLWQSENTGDFHFRDLVTVQATGDTCQVSTNESVEEPFITNYTRIYNPSGELSDTLSIKDYFGYDSLATGNMIFSAGITGNYEGAADNNATLFKHQQK